MLDGNEMQSQRRADGNPKPKDHALVENFDFGNEWACEVSRYGGEVIEWNAFASTAVVCGYEIEGSAHG